MSSQKNNPIPVLKTQGKQQYMTETETETETEGILSDANAIKVIYDHFIGPFRKFYLANH